MTRHAPRTLFVAAVALVALTAPSAVAAAPGDLDPSFGSGGHVLSDVGGWEAGYSSALQADGKIVMAGTSDQNGERLFALARYLPTGSLDVSFGVGGKVLLSSPSADRPQVTVTPDQKIVLAGRGGSGLVVFRRLSDGSPDPAFGVGGVATVPVFNAGGVAGVDVDTSGRVVVGQATTAVSGAVGLACVRFTASGIPDPSFGVGGKFELISSFTRWPLSFALQPDGKPVLTGFTTANFFNPDIFVLRLTTTGAPDPTFGVGGEATLDVAGAWDEAQAIAIEPGGAIVVGGRSYTGVFGNSLWALARFTPNGTPDATFGAGGKVTFDASTGDDVVLGLAVVSNKIFATGQTGGPADLPLARFSANGSVDSTFGVGGIAGGDFVIGLATGWNLLAQPNGALVVTGDAFSGVETFGDFALARYLGVLPDSTAPVITTPGNLSADATGPGGATVTYRASATDDVDGTVPVSCSPESGSPFPIGTTTVNCTAKDTAGNEASASFSVHAKGAGEQLDDLLTAITGIGPGSSLADKLNDVQSALSKGAGAKACDGLGAFVNQVKAQSGKTLSSEQETTLVAAADRIRAVLAC